MKGQFLIVVGKDENNQMFPIALVVIKKEIIESWAWFIEQLKSYLYIGDGLGWSMINDMQKVCKFTRCGFYLQ